MPGVCNAAGRPAPFTPAAAELLMPGYSPMVALMSRLSCRVLAVNTNAAGNRPLRTEVALSPVQARPPVTAVLSPWSQLAFT